MYLAVLVFPGFGILYVYLFYFIYKKYLNSS